MADAMADAATGLGRGGSQGRLKILAERLLDSPNRTKTWWDSLTESFDQKFLFLITGVYFLQGMGGFGSLAMTYFLKDSLAKSCTQNADGEYFYDSSVEGCHRGFGLSPDAQTALKVTAGLPWNYKILYGMTSDCFPIMGSNRRSYIMLAGIAGTIGYIGLFFVAASENISESAQTMVMLLYLLTNLSTAFCDVCTDALVATNAKTESETGAGDLQSLCWMGLYAAVIISGVFAGRLYEWLDAPMCFLLSAFVPALRLLLAMGLKEDKAGKKMDFQLVIKNSKKVWKTLSHPGVHRPIAFIFLAGATIPDMGSPQTNYITDMDSHGWKAGYEMEDGTLHFYTASELNSAINTTEKITCDWLKAHDPGCKGDWLLDNQLNTNKTQKTMLLGGRDIHITVPTGYNFATECYKTACDCQLLPRDPAAKMGIPGSDKFTTVFDSDGDGEATKEEVGLLMKNLGLPITGNQLEHFVKVGSAGTPDTPAVCYRLVKSEPPGLSVVTAKEACPLFANELHCDFDLSGLSNPNRAAGIPGLKNHTTVEMVCPSQCNKTADICGVVGGDGSSCAAEILAAAWMQCPEACQTCDINKKGCLAFSSNFISSLSIVGGVMGLAGTAVYAAYLKGVPYGKLLFGSVMGLAVFSLSDWLTLSAVDQAHHTVLGLPAGPFVVFDEASNDMMGRLRSMPLLVLAAQVCPAGIEGTLFAFIMQMFNTGGTYSGYFGEWLQSYLEIEQTDYTGLETGQLLRVLFKLTPLLYLWLVPMKNPTEVIEQIDRELSAMDSPNEKGAQNGNSELSGKNQLMPAIMVLICFCPLIVELLSLDVRCYALPTAALLLVPTYETFLRPYVEGQKVGQATNTGLGEGLTTTSMEFSNAMVGGHLEKPQSMAQAPVSPILDAVNPTEL